MSTTSESSNESPLQFFYRTKSGEDNIDVAAMERQYCKARQTYRKQTSENSPASVGTPCSSDESQPELEAATPLQDGEELTSEQKKIRRMQANKRERKRMHTVNEAFDDLRDLVPTYPSNRKLSKIETLRLACAYIQDLAKLLTESNAVHGEDVNLHHHHCDGFVPPVTLQQTYPSHAIKSEFAQPEYNTCNFQHYRVPLSYDYESCPSDPEIQSPPHFSNSVYLPPGLAVKPPALARVSSDTAVSLQMAQTSLATTSSSGYCGSPAITPCSPLTRVQHSSPSLSHITCTPSNFSSSPSTAHFNGSHHYHQMLTGYTHCYSQ